MKAKEIINSAENTSKKLLEDSKLDIKLLVSRKLDMAKKQIESNEQKVFNSIRDEIIDFLSKGITYNLVEIRSFIDRNYSEILIKELKFSKKYWSNYKNSTIETISSIWVEIFEDDQHIKSLDIEINNFDKNVKSDSNEKRLISILEKKDIELKKITEKYGQ